MSAITHEEITGTRAAILDAAETAFAEKGFSGARIDAIAAAAGCNKSLIYQYFGNKLALYERVLTQTNREASELQARIFAPLLANADLMTDASQFREFLTGAFTAVFDHLQARPRLLRILLWEMAEGWQTYKQLRIQPAAALDSQLAAVLQRAQQAGVLRHAYSPAVQLTMALQMCQTFLASFPFYQSIEPGTDFTADGAFSEARQYIVNFIVAGLTADPT